MPLARDVATVGSATLASRLLGFFRDLGIAAVLGAGVFSDAFFAVLQIVNFFRRLLAEGALNAAFVPMWLRKKQAHGENGAARFLRDVLAAMLLAVGVLAAIGLLLAPAVIGLLAPGFDGERQAAAADYLHIAAPYVVLAGMVAVLASVLNAEGRVLAAALGIVAFNAVLLLALAWLSLFGAPQPAAIGAMLAHAIVLAGIVQLAVTGVGFLRRHTAFAREERQKTPRLGKAARLQLGLSTDARRFFALAVPALVAAGIPQLTLIAGTMIASSSPAAVSWLYYANRLYELPLGLVSIAVATVLVPAIAARAALASEASGQRGNSIMRAPDTRPEPGSSARAALASEASGQHGNSMMRSREGDALAAAQSRGFEIALGLALPAAVALAVLAVPIAGALFERGAFGRQDTVAVAAALAAICAGLPGHALDKVLGAVSFAHEDTRTPMLAALAGLAAAVAGSLALFPRYGHVGVAAAIAIAAWTGATLLGAILWRRGWLRLDPAASRRLPRIILATIVMGIAIFVAHELLASPFGAGGSLVRLAMLVLLVAIGVAVYLASLQALGVARLRDLIAAIGARGGQ